MVKLIFFFIILLFIIKNILFKLYEYNNENIEKKNSEKLTKALYKDFHEPLLSNLKNQELISYIKFLLQKYCNEDDLNYKEKPLISVIIPIYNGEKYILQSLLSIESQTLKNIEIIYIDDHSNDNSIKLIKKLQLIDKRIKLYTNKENRATLFTKSFGVTKARGKYVHVIDQDDILINQNLYKNLIYEIENNFLDIIQFRFNDFTPESDYVSFDGNKKNSTFNKIIIQPELGNTESYLNETLYKSFFLWDKLIKKETYLNALKFLGEEIWGKKMVHREDHLMTFALYKMAKKYMRVKIYGYSHIANFNQESQDFNGILLGKEVSQDKREKMLRDQFEFSQILYNITLESKVEKNIAFRELFLVVNNSNFATKVKDKKIKNLVKKTCDIFLKSQFINLERKRIILKFYNLFYNKNNKQYYSFFVGFFIFTINIICFNLIYINSDFFFKICFYLIKILFEYYFIFFINLFFLINDNEFKDVIQSKRIIIYILIGLIGRIYIIYLNSFIKQINKLNWKKFYLFIFFSIIFVWIFSIIYLNKLYYNEKDWFLFSLLSIIFSLCFILLNKINYLNKLNYLHLVKN